METWFLNHVLGVSLSVLLLGLPGPLGAGTPSNNSTDPVTAGLYHSAATDELSNLENNATSTSYSSESLSPSQRNILLTHTAETHTAAADLGKSTVRPAVTSVTFKKLVQFAEFVPIMPFGNIFLCKVKAQCVYFTFSSY